MTGRMAGKVSFITGARQVITRTFDPEACVDLIERERVTLVHGFEVHMKGLTEAQEARPRDVSSLLMRNTLTRITLL